MADRCQHLCNNEIRYTHPGRLLRQISVNFLTYSGTFVRNEDNAEDRDRWADVKGPKVVPRGVRTYLDWALGLYIMAVPINFRPSSRNQPQEPKAAMPRFAANITMMFNEVDFLDRFEAAARAGFKGVEYLFPYDYEPDRLAEKLEANGLTQALHNLPAGDWQAGDRGLACRPDRVGEFQDGVGKAIEYATELGCKRVNCLAGIPSERADPDQVRQTFVDNLKFAASRLDEAGVELVTEPINTRDIPGFYLCHTDQARSIIEDVGSPNLGLQHDIYHMQVMEGDLAPTIEANLDVIRHIQIADTPGRHEPGTGEINYPFIFELLDRLGYDGWVGCEYRPLTTTAAGLGWVEPYLSS